MSETKPGMRMRVFLPISTISFALVSACVRASSPQQEERGDAWLDRLPERSIEDASTLDANLEGLVCRAATDSSSLPCEALVGPSHRHRHRHRPIQPDEIPTLERMLEELPSKASEEYGRILIRLAADYLELACVALRECVRDQLNPPKQDPLAARKAAEIQRMAEEKFHLRCAELLRLQSDGGGTGTGTVTVRELCAN